MKNRVAKLVDIKRIEIFEEEIPSLKENQVLVKMNSVGICGSDMHYFNHGGLGSFKTPLPMAIGHEPAGTVVDGAFKNGARVAIEPGCVSEKNKWVIKGKHNLDTQGTFMGANAPGAFADYAIVDKKQLVEIPSDMSTNFGSLLEPLGVALHAVRMVKVNMMDTVLIVGTGPIGLSVMHVCKKIGVRNIYVIDNHQYRMEHAFKFGCLPYTSDIRASVLFDCAGNNDAINKCAIAGDVASRLALIGIPEQDMCEYNPHKLRTKEMLVQNIRRSNLTLEDSIELFKDNWKDVEQMVTHTAPLDNIQKAFETVAKREDGVLKFMITS